MLYIDDEQEDDFNYREQTHFGGTDERDDIEDMAVAGTKTKIQYQSPSKKKILNNDLNEIESSNNDYQRQEESKSNMDNIIPVSQTNGQTQFSVYYQSQINQKSPVKPNNNAKNRIVSYNNCMYFRLKKKTMKK